MLVNIAVAATLYSVAMLLILHRCLTRLGLTHEEAPDGEAKVGAGEQLGLQLDAVCNHETWIVVCLTNAVTMTVLTLA
jgi:hypothetical protein